MEPSPNRGSSVVDHLLSLVLLFLFVVCGVVFVSSPHAFLVSVAIVGAFVVCVGSTITSVFRGTL